MCQNETMTAAVRVEGLSHNYGERQALREVSFAVESGEMVGLLGPNGGGKTTLFRILATMLRPTAGDASLSGRSVMKDPHGVRSVLGVVFQRPSLDIKLTVMENLRHHGNLHGLSGNDLRKRSRNALIALGLADRARERVESLSGGLARRVELAKSLLHRPSILLLDEPNTGLDPNARRDFLDYLDNLRKRDGVTVLLTTHFLEEAERCDRVGIMHEGRLVAYDTPGKLKDIVGDEVLVLSGPRMPPIRLEGPHAHRLASDLVDRFPEEVSSYSWGRPTLDDVFVHLTGRTLKEAEA